MVPDRLSRRDALHASSVALVGLAGCVTRALDADEPDSPTPTASEAEYSQRVDAPESIALRNPEGKPAVRTAAHSPEEDLFESSASWDYEDWIVTSPRERDALDVAPAATGANAATAFVADTDLSRETLLVHQYDIGACESLRPAELAWSTERTCGDAACTGIRLRYRRRTRDADCHGSATDGSDGPPYSDGSSHSEATFVRIPARIQSYGRFGYQV